MRRAQAAANGAMGVAAEMLRRATAADGVLALDGEPLTSERLRDAMREHAASMGAPMPGDVIVAAEGAAASGHDPGSGPLPAGKPIVIDIWPEDEASACWADMTRTVSKGDPGDAIDVETFDVLCVSEHVGKLFGELIELGFAETQPRQSSHVRDIVAGQALGHA